MFLRYCLGMVLISLLLCSCETPVGDIPASNTVSGNNKAIVQKIIAGQDLLVAEKSANPERFRIISEELKENWEKISAAGLRTSLDGLNKRLAIYQKYFPNLADVYQENISKYNLQKTTGCAYNYYQCQACGFIYWTHIGGCFDDQPADFSCPVCGSGKDTFEPIADQGWPAISFKAVCSNCGYVYDPAAGDPDQGIAPGTSFFDLPAEYVCPLCGYSKYFFRGEE